MTQYSVVTFPKIGGPHEENVIHGSMPKKHRVITLGDKIVKLGKHGMNNNYITDAKLFAIYLPTVEHDRL